MGLAEDIRASIYEEHLDEASFLYEQRGRYLEDAEVTLSDVAGLDARLEAHLDGLALGGAQAEALCASKVPGEDAGIQHAAVRVFCRTGAREALLEALAAIQQAEAPSLAAAGAALSAELPRAWIEVAHAELARCDAKLLGAWARAIGYRGLPLAAELIAAAERTGAAPPECAWALGELRPAAGEAFLLGLLWRGEPAVARAAAIALLKCGSKVGSGEIEVLASQGSPWLAVPLALSAQSRFSLLSELERQASGEERAHALLAFGLAGDPRAIPRLLERLGDEELAKPAAAALQLLTGASLTETAVKPEPKDESVDDDLVEPDESAEPDEPPVRPTTEFRLCTDPKRWQEWLEPRNEELGKHERLRMGVPASAASTAAALDGTALPIQLRAWLGDELQIRYGSDLHFHPDLPVAQQRAILAALSSAPARPHR